jgi:hypothetical protein
MGKTIANAIVSRNSFPSLANCYQDKQSRAMNPEELRIKKLRELAETFKTIADFGRRYDIRPDYIRNILKGKQSFGEKAARRMSQKIAGHPDLFIVSTQENQTNEMKGVYRAGGQISPRMQALMGLMEGLTEKQQNELVNQAQEWAEQNKEVIAQLSTRPNKERIL